MVIPHTSKSIPPALPLLVESIICDLVVVSLVMLVVDLVVHPNAVQFGVLWSVVLNIAYVFLGVFVIRLDVAQEWWRYLRHTWWYILAAISLATILAQSLRAIWLVGLARQLRKSGYPLYEQH